MNSSYTCFSPYCLPIRVRRGLIIAKRLPCVCSDGLYLERERDDCAVSGNALRIPIEIDLVPTITIRRRSLYVRCIITCAIGGGDCGGFAMQMYDGQSKSASELVPKYFAAFCKHPRKNGPPRPY